jgi:hypothetical protein
VQGYKFSHAPNGTIICSAAGGGFLKIWKSHTGLCIKS